MVEDGLHLGVEYRSRVRAVRKVSVEQPPDRAADVGGGVSLTAPVEDELVVQVGEQRSRSESTASITRLRSASGGRATSTSRSASTRMTATVDWRIAAAGSGSTA